MKRTLRALAALSVFLVAGLLGVATRTQAQVLTTGTIAGTISDPSGKALSGVQITILDTGQTDVTNANGYFAITDVLPGTHTVRASLVGWQPIEATNVVVTQDLTTTINLQFQSREVRQLGTTTVVAPLIHKNVTPTLYTVTSKEEQLVRSQPNNLYQYPGALISQPGIVPDQNGYPSVRGSRQNEVGYMLDGILITEPVTGQFATNLVTVGLDRMNVYTGGYRAEFGSSIGGIINAVIKTGASMRGQAAVEATTGSWDYSGVVYEQGNVEKSGFNWYVSGNFWRTRFEKNPAVAALPVSEDVLAKLIQPIGKKDRLVLLYTNGFEHYDYNLNDTFTGHPFGYNPLDPGAFAGVQSAHTTIFNFDTDRLVSTPYTTDYEVQMHNIGSATWSHAFSAASSLSAQVYGWNHHVNFHGLSPVEVVDEIIANKQTNGRVDFSTQLSPAFQFRIGGEAQHSNNTLDIFANAGVVATDNGLVEIRQLSKNHPPTDDRNVYLSTTWKPSSRLTLDLGVRRDQRTYHRRVTLDEINLARSSTKSADLDVLAHTGMDPQYHMVTPRAGLTFSLSPSTLLKGSIGRFAQFAPASYIERSYSSTIYDEPIIIGGAPFIPTGVNWYQYRNRKVFDVKPEKVDGVDVGIEHQFGKYLGLAVTPYYRKTTDMFERGNAYDYNGNPIGGGTAYSNRAHGHTRGVETKLEMRETHGLSGWITYTFQEAKATTTASFPGTSDPSVTSVTQEHRLDYDQKHTIYVVGQYVTGNFEINPMLELGSGYPWGGQPGDYVDPTTGNGNPYYSTSPNPADNGAALPILVNGKLQTLTPAPYNTGWHKNLSVTFRVYTNKQKSSYYFLQIQNILNSKDVTARYWFDPFTGSNVFGYVPGTTTYTNENGQTVTAPGHFEYRPYTTVPPVFALIGVRATF